MFRAARRRAADSDDEREEEELLVLPMDDDTLLHIATPGAIMLARKGFGRFKLPNSTPLARLTEQAAAITDWDMQSCMLFLRRATQHEPEHEELLTLMAAMAKNMSDQLLSELLQQLTRGEVNRLTSFLATRNEAGTLITLFGDGPTALPKLANFLQRWRVLGKLTVQELSMVLCVIDDWFSGGDDPLCVDFFFALTVDQQGWSVADSVELYGYLMRLRQSKWNPADVLAIAGKVAARMGDAGTRNKFARTALDNWQLKPKDAALFKGHAYGSQQAAEQALAGTKSTVSKSGSGSAQQQQQQQQQQQPQQQQQQQQQASGSSSASKKKNQRKKNRRKAAAGGAAGNGSAAAAADGGARGGGGGGGGATGGGGGGGGATSKSAEAQSSRFYADPSMGESSDDSDEDEMYADEFDDDDDDDEIDLEEMANMLPGGMSPEDMIRMMMMMGGGGPFGGH